MPDITEPLTCHAVKQCILAANDALIRADAIVAWIYPAQLSPGILRMCDQCRANSGSNPRNCTGWHFNFRGRFALEFNPVQIKGHNVKVSLEGQYSTQRTTSSDWLTAPFSISNSTVAVKDEQDTLLTRQHLDLAERQQGAPVWHLQLGGLPHGDERPRYEWLDVPRWPTYPLDFMLTIELVLFSFMPEKWAQLNRTEPWKTWVQRSETLILSHYYERLRTYWNQRSSAPSWLAAQCNTTSQWNPRPP